MEYRLLAYFMAICEELHFTKAAVKLGIAQPTLSQQIRRLENEVGTPLFQRIGKKNVLTQAGHILLEHTMKMFHEAEQAKLKINELQGMNRGKLRLGCSGNHLVMNTIIAFHQEYPNIELSVIELATEETRERLLNNQLDLGVIFLPVQDERLESLPLYQEELVLVVSSDHELACADSVTLAALQNISLAMLPDPFLVRRMFDLACSGLGIRVKPIIEMSTLESLLQMAIHHLAAAILPRSYMENKSLAQIRQIPIVEPTPQQMVGVVYRKDTFMGAAIHAFISHLTRNLQP